MLIVELTMERRRSEEEAHIWRSHHGRSQAAAPGREGKGELNVNDLRPRGRKIPLVRPAPGPRRPFGSGLLHPGLIKVKG